jgi:hypothetical protein
VLVILLRKRASNIDLFFYLLIFMKLQRFVKQYIGSSFPVLIETENFENYVLKMRGAGNGPLSLIAEFIANRVASRIGWQVPDVHWIEIPQNFPWTFGTDEFDDIVQKSYGWNLGIIPIEEAVQIHAQEFATISYELLEQLFTIDLFFINVDRTISACNIVKDKHSTFWIIDHGALGLFQNISTGTNTIFRNHILVSSPLLTELVYRPVFHSLALFEETIEEIPNDILLDARITRPILLEIINSRIHFLQKIL